MWDAALDFKFKLFLLSLLKFDPDVLNFNSSVFDDTTIGYIWTGRFARLIFGFSSD